ALTVASVKVASRRLDRKVDQPEPLIHADLGPDARVAGVFRRTVQPGVVAELALLRDSMEDPQPLAGAHVVPTDVALIVPHGLRRHAFAEGGPDDDGVPGNHRRGLESDFAAGA